MLIALGLSLFLTFSYKIVEIFIRIFRSKSLVRFSLYFWAVGTMILVPFSKGNYIFSSPDNIIKVMPVFLILIIANCVLARFSGYNPIGKFNIINFVITYPVIEEFIFRGLILSYLNQYLSSEVLIQVMYMPVTLSVVITALLFAITHLQYYSLSRQSIRYMIFAFMGGIFFGAITDLTHSILLSCLLHIEFNLLAVYFAKKT
ncbi:CAAX protease self-immunity [Paenibacillus uliginis N3/975]|uniref:CAAX protease self-immunity n=1 Tax=Paenibacillus uliginis N3/975 TaxID=1313296 RepID=A0A1X7HTK0_9BACL|nr:CAAX protease self-immunity [Paenibacillus uliginis N3/975]